ncbi:MAG: type II secretion system F family protein [Campylobacterota bacterium]|nr:type II secretion system F family protein [Campylobacterota bacterium]
MFELFTQLTIMLDANLTLSQSIELMLKSKQNIDIKDILILIQDSINTGKPIEKVLKGYQKYLGESSVLFLKLGIENGNIKESISSLVELMDEDRKSYEKLNEIIRYPLVLVASLIVAISMIFIYVVPNFEYIFKMLEELPLATKILLWIKDTVENYFIFIVLFFIAMGFSIYLLYLKYRYSFDTFMIKNIPVVSKLLQSYIFFRLFLSMSIIVKSKYQFQIAIEHSKSMIENLYIKKVMDNILTSIKNGNSIAKSFENTLLFDNLTIRLLYTAEQTNSYDKVLNNITTYYKNKFNNSIKLFSSILEPTIIFIISIVVLWLVLAVMLPMWDLSSAIS